MVGSPDQIIYGGTSVSADKRCGSHGACVSVVRNGFIGGAAGGNFVVNSDVAIFNSRTLPEKYRRPGITHDQIRRIGVSALFMEADHYHALRAAFAEPGTDFFTGEDMIDLPATDTVPVPRRLTQRPVPNTDQLEWRLHRPDDEGGWTPMASAVYLDQSEVDAFRTLIQNGGMGFESVVMDNIAQRLASTNVRILESMGS